jgi:hypothetical protein
VEYQSGEVSGKREIAPTLRGGSHTTFFTFSVSRDLSHTPNWLTHILLQYPQIIKQLPERQVRAHSTGWVDALPVTRYSTLTPGADAIFTATSAGGIERLPDR